MWDDDVVYLFEGLVDECDVHSREGNLAGEWVAEVFVVENLMLGWYVVDDGCR